MYENVIKVIDAAIAEKDMFLDIYKKENDKLKQENESLRKLLEMATKDVEGIKNEND